MSGSAEGTVESQITILNNYASSAMSSAQAALSELAAIEYPNSYPTTYSFTVQNFNPTASTPPESINLDASPSVVSPSISDVPTEPSISIPTLGALATISIPETPTLSFPSLSTSAPTYTFQDPQSWSFNVGNVVITDDPMIQTVIDRLTANIQTGGTGLSAAVEAAIWARGVEREEQQLDDSLDKSTSMWAKKGFSLPDGQLADSLMALQTEYLNRRLDRSREIEIKQAELEQTNLFKSMELAVNLASTLINMLIRYEELVFKGQEATAKFANEYIDMQIKTYSALIEAYKAEATVHESIVRAELSKVEIFKAEIEAQIAIGQVNELTVKAYAEQIRAAIAQVDIYKSQIEGYVAKAQIEKIKIEANVAQFDAWSKKVDAQISAYNGAIEAFKAQAMVNISTADFYSKQAEAGLRSAIASAELGIKSFEVSERSNLMKQNSVMEAARGVAQAYSSMAAGAMAAVAAHAGVTYSESATVTP